MDLSNARSYRIRRKFWKVFGAAFHVYGPSDELLGYSKQKAFRLREDIRVYGDESLATEVLTIHARQIVDFSAAYDVLDARERTKVGAARRKGFASILRDSWELLDASDRPIARLREDGMGMALLRRFLTNLIPQRFTVESTDGRLLARMRQRFNPFVYTLHVDLQQGADVDPRLVLAAGILISAVEGRQN
jgi:hypothetical protein